MADHHEAIKSCKDRNISLSFPQGTKYSSSYFFSKIFSDAYSALCFYFHYFSSDKSQKSQRKLQLQHYIKIQEYKKIIQKLEIQENHREMQSKQSVENKLIYSKKQKFI